MLTWSRWIGVGAALGTIFALIPIVRGNVRLENGAGPLGKLQQQALGKSAAPDFAGLDLLHLEHRPQRVLAPLSNGRHAELTLDPQVQAVAEGQLRRYKMPEAGLVLLDVKTGRILAYASQVSQGAPFDVNLRAEPPAASVFKVITGATLIERAGLNAGTEQCYHGGKSRISADELREDAARDRWCATLGQAMGRSINVVFGRLAQKHLKPTDVSAMAGAFGLGAPVPFAVANDATKVDIPADPIEFARASAGFWHTTLSPLAAVGIAQTVASGGVTLQPRIVDRILDPQGKTQWEEESRPKALRRAIQPATAAELTRMMLQTVSEGSARSAFHDGHGEAYLPGIEVAGKTGTLTRVEGERYYTWFVGFAPANQPEVAVASLVVNNPSWQIKAPTLARNLLRAYFAKAGRQGVTLP